ncbi:glycosyltransferase family 4 protein [soil metagenome]
MSSRQSKQPPNIRVSKTDNLRVAIVQDWIYGGGAELVVEQLHKMFPDSPIYTSYCTDEWRKRLDNKVVTGILQRWPFNKLRKYIPFLRIWWFSGLDLKGYDLIISVSGNGEAKGVKVPAGTKHIWYCHAPTHFYWRHYKDYLREPGFGFFNPVARLGLKLLVRPLRKWDYKASQYAHAVIANSSHTQAEVKKFYSRDSAVVHPPVYIERFMHTMSPAKRHGFVIAGRQTPYKRFDIAVLACTELELPLTVIGAGPEHEKLKQIAGPTVKFLGRAPDKVVEEELARAQAFLFPAYEDFGIAPVEAMAAGTPVIAYKAGGALDYVVEGKTGMFFEEQRVESLVSALQSFNPKDYSADDIKAAAQEFSIENFHKNLHDKLKTALQ